MNAVFNPLDHYVVSLITFLLVTINSCIDLNGRLIELGSAVDNVSRGRLIWFYFSATFSYIQKTIIGMFVIFVLITLIIVIIIGIFSIIKSGGQLKKGASKDDVMQKMTSEIFAAISKYVKSNIEYIFTYLITMDAFIGFFVIFPLFMFIFITAYALSVYQPTVAEVSEDEGPKKSLVMSTVHYFLYYLFVCYLGGVILFVIYNYFMSQ